jgi:predicted KAP-like P-loop ATPase
LASVVAKLLSDEPEARVIGILGPWGCGKSTAVKQIEVAVAAKDSKKTHFFTYDAWLNQADPVRRSFLEALVTFLVSKRRVDEATWRAASKWADRMLVAGHGTFG